MRRQCPVMGSGQLTESAFVRIVASRVGEQAGSSDGVWTAWKRQWGGSDSVWKPHGGLRRVSRGKQGLTTQAQLCGHFSFASGDPARDPGGDALGLRCRFRLRSSFAFSGSSAPYEWPKQLMGASRQCTRRGTPQSRGLRADKSPYDLLNLPNPWVCRSPPSRRPIARSPPPMRRRCQSLPK